MSEKYFEKMAEFALEDLELHIVDEKAYKQYHRQVLSALKQVERDARHSAMDIVYKAANEVINNRLDSGGF